MVCTRPMIFPWDLIDLDQLLIWFLSLIISGSFEAMETDLFEVGEFEFN